LENPIETFWHPKWHLSDHAIFKRFLWKKIVNAPIRKQFVEDTWKTSVLFKSNLIIRNYKLWKNCENVVRTVKNEVKVEQIQKFILVSVFVVSPDEDGALFGDGDDVVPIGAVLNTSDRASLGLADRAKASLLVLPNLE